QFLARDRPFGRPRKHDVSTLGIEAAGERIEYRCGTRALRDVVVLLETAPRVIGYRPCAPDQPSGLFDLGARYPADLLDALCRVTSAQPGIELEARVAGHFAVQGGDPVFSLQRKMSGLAVVAAGSRVIRQRPRGLGVPRQKPPYVAIGSDVALGQQPA